MDSIKVSQEMMLRAIHNGDEEKIRQLTEDGVDLGVNYDGVTCLHIAAQYERPSVMEYLIRSGANLEAKTYQNGWTALHYAVAQGHECIVQCLIKAGSDIEAKDNNGRTPIYYSRLRGHENVTNLLLHATTSA